MRIRRSTPARAPAQRVTIVPRGARAATWALALALCAPELARPAALAPADPAGTNAARALPAAPRDFVYDEAGWLATEQRTALVQQLLQYERESSDQILVAIFKSLQGEDLADFSNRVANAWGIGQQGRDNGILLAIYADERKVDIEVGYGLEGKVTDLTSDLIIRERIGPAFRHGQYYEGIRDAVVGLIAASRGEFAGSGKARTDQRRGGGGSGFVFWMIFMVIFFLGVAGRRRSMLGPVLLGSAMARRQRRGGWDDFTRGGGWFGGGGGGGGLGGGSFSGGGGHFGGGGARGGW